MSRLWLHSLRIFLKGRGELEAVTDTWSLEDVTLVFGGRSFASEELEKLRRSFGLA